MSKARSTEGLRPSYPRVLRAGELVVGFDPGLTTGVCALRYGGDGVHSITVEQSAEIAWDARLQQIGAYVASADHIVVESFRLYAHKATAQINNSFPSAQVIGVIDVYAWLYIKLERIVEQPASDIARTQVLPDHRALIGASEHRKDAYKHARLYILKCLTRPGATM